MSNIFSRIATPVVTGLLVTSSQVQAAPPVNMPADANARIVLEALDAMFVKRDVTALDRYFVKTNYLQHNPGIPNGTDSLRGLIPNLGADFKYERGMVVSQGELVMVQNRYVGWGPKPMVAVDIFRLENGKIAEHWDVMQEEVPAAQSKNGNPMFVAQPTATGLPLASNQVQTTPPVSKPTDANARIVLEALDAMFVKRDVTALDRYFVKTNYLQHNPGIPNGTDSLRGLIPNLGTDFKYERGMVVSQGELVMVHNRYVGWGPKPMVAVDIFRLENGKIAEHWDVMQEEVPAAQSKNGNPMFVAQPAAK